MSKLELITEQLAIRKFTRRKIDRDQARIFSIVIGAIILLMIIAIQVFKIIERISEITMNGIKGVI